MRCLVTGCAGFIGSHVSERLLADGHDVIGIDALTDFYSTEIKCGNLAVALQHPNFRLINGDLLSLTLDPVLDDVDVVFHLAGQPGVRASWGTQFNIYSENNILATQRLLEAARHAKHLQRFVYASSSSVYGNAPNLPVYESSPTQPLSPYGVTKLAAEHLCTLYHVNFGVPAVSLRYFTVYGPRQRPDMAFHRFIVRALQEQALTVHEDGNQTRDFTYVTDIVQATIHAATQPRAIGHVYNVAGGTRIALNAVLTLLQHILKRELRIDRVSKQAGDVRDTYADITAAQRDLCYVPSVDLAAGLRDEVEWVQQHGKIPAGLQVHGAR